MAGRNRIAKFVLALLAWYGSAHALGQGPAASGPIFSRDRSFRIPYSVDAAQAGRIKEVQLHVSTDRGNTWRPAAQGPPSSEFFTFTASGDGEHWFTVRTIDVDGRGDPPSLAGISPGLVVQVDTTPPHINLRAMSPAGDELGIEWEIHDEQLDPATMRVEYRAGSNDWFPVKISPSTHGRTRFRPGARGPIELRLRVLDRAGNEAVQQITLQPAGTGRSPSPASAGGTPAFGTGHVGPSTAPGPLDFHVPPPPTSTAPATSSTFEKGSFQPASPQPGVVNPEQPMARPVAPAPNQGAPAAQPVSQPSPAPRGNVQLVNSLRFAINYEVMEMGRSGIRSIALYWTYDGMQWNLQGDDEDRESPFAVEVDGEGVFGFKLVARSGAGLGDDPPKSGDSADVWVEVDITPPEIDLRPPQPGGGSAGEILDIQWQARDKNPAPKPISISYAESASGPWKPIVEGIENTGRFQWAIPKDPSMPYKFFIRMECKDRAGNVGRAETPQEVVVDLTRPRVRILRVEPAGQKELSVSPDFPEPIITPE